MKQEYEESSSLAGQVPGNYGSGSGNSGMVPLPLPAQGGAVAYGDDTFLEGQQQAVIAWNGKTDGNGVETLILTTNEKSATGQPMAMLSVLPLPGEPQKIERANAKVFVQSKALIKKKLAEMGKPAGAGGLGVIMTKKIGAHNIFVWKMDDISTFKEDVQSYIASQYDNKATALVTENTLRVIKRYHDRGFRYFAFDLTMVESAQTMTKEAIAYQFKSNFAYFPLEISKIGGTGGTFIDLVIATPGSINLAGEVKDNDVILLGNASVNVSMNELKTLDPSLFSVFDGSNLSSVKMRNFLIRGRKIDSFNGDFMAVPAQ